ncbi:unnamed protein product [Protopolystoma xenopodis]|uniref:Ciliogenesis-associated TTC17-interacting protein N-terminal domain-containing protein n=1 Tax=Protopolystoma xenopodis TaxID=117903 RepID=A0A3S5BGM9_9PLAT|nr:unnamed protein product [Protopolystoma xenopodis]
MQTSHECFKVSENCGVSLSKYKDNDVICVKAISDGKIGNVICGTNIEAYMTFNLETLYQIQKEYVKLERRPIERTSIVKKYSDHYKFIRTVSEEDKSEIFQNKYHASKLVGFISEGANLVLQRLLVTRDFPPCFEALSMDESGSICQVLYLNMGERTQKIADNKVNVLGIQRKLQSTSGLSASWQSFFMLDGHLISRAQVGSPVILKVTLIPKFIESDKFLEKPFLNSKSLCWDEDLELYHRYIEKKLDSILLAAVLLFGGILLASEWMLHQEIRRI